MWWLRPATGPPAAVSLTAGRPEPTVAILPLRRPRETRHPMILPRIRQTALEPDIRSIGSEIFRRAEAAAPSVFSMEFAQSRVLNWLTRDDDLKLRLFRFIEVMPDLRDSAAIAVHLDEYLRPRVDGSAGESLAALSTPVKLALSLARPDAAGAALVADAIRWGCGLGARHFIAGATPREALATVRKLRHGGAAFTMDVLGETIIADHVARRHQALYLDLIDHLSRQASEWPEKPVLDRAPWGPLPKVNISIKLSAIVPRFDPIDPVAATESVLDRLRPILRRARDTGAFINIDMEHYAVKDLTLDIFKRVLTEPAFKGWADCGIVIQCYMPEGEGDLSELIAWARRRGTPITVRLVKGAYWDSETAGAVLNRWPVPLFEQKWESDAAFERVGRLMLENADVVRPAFASHNVRSIAAVLAMEQALGLPQRTLELQMLTGMGDQLRRAMIAMKQRVRVYAPFGDLITGMAYLIRRLIENTANESFLRQSFGENVPIGRLLDRPAAPPPGLRAALPKPFIQDPDENCDMEPFEGAPDLDFSRPANRDAMQAALVDVRSQFGREYPPVIDNEPVRADRWRDSLNPSNPREVVGRTAVCDVALADRAVSAARRAFGDWAGASVEDRASVLDRAADILCGRRFEIVAWMILEVGKTWREAQGDFMETADYLRFYAREMRRLAARPRRRDFPGETNEYAYTPRGVVFVTGPFCFPTALFTGMVAAAVVTGNTVVAKPAGAASVCGAKMCEILIEAGLPRGVLNYVPGEGREVGRHLVRHSGVDMIAFTGSRDVGCGIMEDARRLHPQRDSFKHVIAEMGGNNAIIIDDDADLDEAVQATMASAFGYSGQKCTACSRVIVVGGAYEDYLDKLAGAAAAVRPASAELPGTTVGPLIDEAAVAKAKAFVEMGNREARCLLAASAQADAGPGYFFAPVVFADVAPDAHIAREECMAPILAVLRAESFDRAIDMANATPYGLAGGVYSRSPRNIELAKRRLDVGMLYINRKITLSRVDRQPFGGFKMSGLGTKTGGSDYLQQFMLPKTISENTMRHGFSVDRSKEARQPIGESH